MPWRASCACSPRCSSPRIFIAFVLGPAGDVRSRWQEYFTDPRPWLYVPLTASLVTHSLTLPGVFEHVPDERA